MVTGEAGVLAPQALMLPTRELRNISGAVGEINISGGFIYFCSNDHWWSISGSAVAN